MLHLRSFLLLVLVVSPAVVACGSECSEDLEVELRTFGSGSHRFAGTADGERFVCTYTLAGWDAGLTDEACTGDVRLELRGRPSETSLGWKVVVVFDGRPEIVDWTWGTDGEAPARSEPFHATGRLEPKYDDGDCEGSRTVLGGD